jgi:hypothetical protein
LNGFNSGAGVLVLGDEIFFRSNGSISSISHDILDILEFFSDEVGGDFCRYLQGGFLYFNRRKFCLGRMLECDGGNCFEFILVVGFCIDDVGACVCKSLFYTFICFCSSGVLIIESPNDTINSSFILGLKTVLDSSIFEIETWLDT